MNWLLENWEYVLIFFYVAEKIVKLTPTKYDDIVVDVLFSGLKQLFGKTDKKEPKSKLPK